MCCPFLIVVYNCSQVCRSFDIFSLGCVKFKKKFSNTGKKNSASKYWLWYSAVAVTGRRISGHPPSHFKCKDHSCSVVFQQPPEPRDNYICVLYCPVPQRAHMTEISWLSLSLVSLVNTKFVLKYWN